MSSGHAYQKLLVPKFSTWQYPFQKTIPRDMRQDELHFVIPYNIFRSGARAWSDFNGDDKRAGSYFAALQFLGEMIKYSQYLGSEEGFYTTRYDTNNPIPKISFLVTLIPAMTQRMSPQEIFYEDLPIHELTTASNRACFLISIISTDPSVKILDLIRCQVGENMAAQKSERRSRNHSEMNCTIAHMKMENGILLYGNERNRKNPANGNGGEGGEGGGGGEEEEQQDQQQQQQQQDESNGNNNKGKRRKRNKCQDVAVEIPSENVLGKYFQAFDNLFDIIRFLIDRTMALDQDREKNGLFVYQERSFVNRKTLDTALDANVPDPRVDIKRLLSLESVLKNQVIATKLIAPHNKLASINEYYCGGGGDAAENIAGNLKFPVPELTWEYDITQCSAVAFATMAFPWTIVSPLYKYGSIISRRLGITVNQAIVGIRTFALPKKSACDTVSSFATAAAAITNEMVNASSSSSSSFSSVNEGINNDNNIMISLPVAKRRNMGCCSLPKSDINAYIGSGGIAGGKAEPMDENIKLSDLSILDGVGGFKVYKNVVRELGQLVKNSIEFCRLMEIEDVETFRKENEVFSNKVTATIDDTDIIRSLMLREEEKRQQQSSPPPQANVITESEIESKRFQYTRLVYELQNTALEDYAGLLDPTSPIPDNLKGCVEWIKERKDISLPFNIHSGNIGIFGNICATLVGLIRQLGVASNQYPTLFIIESAHALGVAWASGHLPPHPFISAKYESGKTYIFEEAAGMLMKAYVEHTHGSSLKGNAPRPYTDENGNRLPPGECLILNDELRNEMVVPRGKLSGDEASASSHLAAVMTHTGRDGSGLTYNMVGKDSSDNLCMHREIIDTMVGVAGATNAPKTVNAIRARMVDVDVLPAGNASRTATKYMIVCQTQEMSVRRELIRETFLRLHVLTIMVYNLQICGALPLPNNDLYFIYFGRAYDYISKNKSEILKRIRVVDVAYTLAMTDAIWLGVCMLYANFGEFRDDEKFFDLKKLRAIIPYLQIDEDITFFRIAWMVNHGTDKVIYKLLRWWAEKCGLYPFIKYHKDAVKEYFDNSKFIPKHNVMSQSESESVKRLSSAGKEKVVSTNSNTVVSTRQLGMVFGIIDETSRNSTSSTPVLFNNTTTTTTTTTAAANNNNNLNEQSKTPPKFADLLFSGEYPVRMTRSQDITAIITAGKGHRTSKIKRSNYEIAGGYVPGMIDSMPETFEQYEALYGATIEIPIIDQNSSTAPQKKFGPTKYTRDEYVEQIFEGRVSKDSITYTYKVDPLMMSDGKMQLYINPNYIVVKGTPQSLASNYILADKNTRMTEKDVITALEGMIRGENVMTAHVLPSIPLMNCDMSVLSKLENIRVNLWHDPRCKTASLPIVIGNNKGICVLVEALLESPYFVIQSVLSELCNESTVERNVVIPIPSSKYTHTLKTVHVKPKSRILRTTNPLYAGDSESNILTKNTQTAIHSQEYGTKQEWEWKIDSEEKSILEYCRKNGCVIDNKQFDASKYTYKSKFERLVNSDMHAGPHKYPDDIIKETKAFDNRFEELS